MEYFLTSEFWWNILWGGVVALCWLGAIFVFFKITPALLDGMGCGGLIVAVLVVFPLPLNVGMHVANKIILYPRLWEENRGPVIIIAKEAPLLHNYFLALGRSLSRTKDQIQKLNTERSNSTTTEARKVYETQIAQQENRKQELENMKRRIEGLAQRLYFSKYLARLGHLSADANIDQELREVQGACAQLIRGE